MSDPTTLIIAEIAKAFLQAYFTQMSLAGKTEAEIDAMYKAEQVKFAANTPDKLPKV